MNTFLSCYLTSAVWRWARSVLSLSFTEIRKTSPRRSTSMWLNHLSNGLFTCHHHSGNMRNASIIQIISTSSSSLLRLWIYRISSLLKSCTVLSSGPKSFIDCYSSNNPKKASQNNAYALRCIVFVWILSRYPSSIISGCSSSSALSFKTARKSSATRSNLNYHRCLK